MPHVRCSWGVIHSSLYFRYKVELHIAFVPFPYRETRNPTVLHFSTSSLHFCHHPFRTFCSAVLQLGDAHASIFQQNCNHPPSGRTGIPEDAIFHRMNWCKFLWGHPCKAIETCYYWDSCLWDFAFSVHFFILLHERIRTRIRMCRFCTFIDIATETAIVFIRTLPVDFHYQQSPGSFCPRIFVPWFLTTTFLL